MNSTRVTLLLFSLFFFLCIFKINTIPVAVWDERTNLYVIQEISVSGNPFLLHYKGKPFFEKPPLYYVTTSILFTITHDLVFSGRMVSVIASLGTAFLVYRWLKEKEGNKAANIGLLFLISTGQLFIVNAGGVFSSHLFWSADLDSLQIFFLLSTFFLLTRKSPRIYWAAVTTACAVLTKGPMGFLPFLFFSVLYFEKYRGVLWKAWGVLLFFLIPWYVYMTALFGTTFLTSHFGFHVFERFIVPLDGHKESWWYPLRVFLDPRIAIGFIPSIFALFAVRHKQVLLWSSTIVFLLLPFFIQTKLAWYALPFYPFAAIVVGMWSSDMSKRNQGIFLKSMELLLIIGTISTILFRVLAEVTW